MVSVFVQGENEQVIHRVPVRDYSRICFIQTTESSGRINSPGIADYNPLHTARIQTSLSSCLVDRIFCLQGRACQEKYKDCCYPFLIGASKPETPEQLMRSRYSAFCTKNIEYLFSTCRICRPVSGSRTGNGGA